MANENKDLESLLLQDSRRLRSFYLDERNKLLHEVQRITGELKRIDSILGYIDGGRPSSSDTSDNQYNTSWYWWEKAKFVLQQKNKPCTIRDILQFAYELEGKTFDITLDSVRSDYSAIYSDVSKKAKNNDVFWRSRNENIKQFEYGLVEWNKVGGIS